MSSSNCIVTGALQGFKAVVSPASGDFQPRDLSWAVSGPHPGLIRQPQWRAGREQLGLSSLEMGPVPSTEKSRLQSKIKGARSLRLSQELSSLSRKSYRYPRRLRLPQVHPDQSPSSYYKYYIISGQLHSINTG